METNNNEKMSTPISQLINKSDTESIEQIIISSESPVLEDVNTNAINYNQNIHTNNIKTIQENHPQNNQLFRPEYGMMPPSNDIIFTPKNQKEDSSEKEEIICQNNTNFFSKLKSLIIITLLFVLIANKKVYMLIKKFLPFFNNFSSSLPRLLLRGFILGLLYLTIEKFLSM